MEKLKLYEYSSNNSGGSDWLSAKDWRNLEKAGWVTYDFFNFKYNKAGNYVYNKKGFPVKIKPTSKNPHSAFKFFNSEDEAIDEFQRITGQDYYAEGCNCCGRPHSIYESN